MTREEVKQYLKDNKILSGKELTQNKHKEVKEIIIKMTEFLEEIYPKVSTGLRLRSIVNDIKSKEDIPKCKREGCNDPVGLGNGGRFGESCSRRCNILIAQKQSIASAEKNPDFYEKRNKKTAKTCQEKAKEMGISNWEDYVHPSMFQEGREKAKQTQINLYGGVGYAGKSIMEKARKTTLLRYGTDNHMQVESIKKRSLIDKETGGYRIVSKSHQDKARETMREKYGVDYFTQSEEGRERIRKANMEKYGRISPNQSHIPYESMEILNDREKLSELVQGRFLDDVASDLGVHMSSVQRACASLGINIKRTSSKAESEIEDFIASLGYKVERNIRVREINREIDVYVPEKKLAIEYNGVYWHSEEYKHKSYHQEKTLKLQELGYKVIHIWEDDWGDPIKKEIILGKIRSKLQKANPIMARKTKVGLIQKDEAESFFNKNHIQGHVNGSVYIGLRSGEELVACMTFKQSGDRIYDLSRFATSRSVIGGAGKCLNFFKKNYDWEKIYTFASLDYSEGNLYEMIGFEKDSITPPNLWYMKRGQWIRLGRRRFTKNKLSRVLENFDPDLSEKDNMINNGYVRIFDSGSIKYVMKKGA